FECMKAIVESHGGTVEKFIGDAVMAVFGIPAAHEDDALRACRAAGEMRDALPELGIRGRIGVNTGEVVTGTSERLATGDAVNVAARFEQAAAPGEVLIGEATHALASDAVAVEPVEPLTLKGKSAPVPAYRLLSVLDVPDRSHASRFVGREPELAQIVAAWERVKTQTRCQLITVIGDAGVGKSRLVAEALAAVEARVLRGRCPPYGDGITYWPVVEVVKQLGKLPSDPVAAAAIRSLLGDWTSRPPQTRSPGHSESCSRSRRRWSSSSTTSSGETRRSSTWSSRRRCSRPALRSCSCAWRVRSCSTGAPAGPAFCGSSRCSPSRSRR